MLKNLATSAVVAGLFTAAAATPIALVATSIGDNDTDKEFVEISTAYSDEAAQITTQNRYHGPATKPKWLTTPCEYEDSVNCYWNAQKFGNGEGHSYWVIPLKGSRYAVVYWNARYNNRNGFVLRDAW